MDEDVKWAFFEAAKALNLKIHPLGRGNPVSSPSEARLRFPPGVEEARVVAAVARNDVQAALQMAAKAEEIARGAVPIDEGDSNVATEESSQFNAPSRTPPLDASEGGEDGEMGGWAQLKTG
jgi:hypothetical protein